MGKVYDASIAKNLVLSERKDCRTNGLMKRCAVKVGLKRGKCGLALEGETPKTAETGGDEKKNHGVSHRRTSV